MVKDIGIVINEINVNAIQAATGIFIGTNKNNGWSSHSKHNIGFGNVYGSSNISSSNQSFVLDNEIFDIFIDDRDFMFSLDTDRDIKNTTVNLDSININAMIEGAGVFTGENQQFGWSAHQKQNSNVLNRGKSNLNTYSLNMIDDRDQYDATINDQDFKAGIMNRS